MNQLNVQLPSVSAEAQVTLDLVQKKIGRVPNMYKVMAQSNAVLSAYYSFSSALSTGALPTQLAEKIAIAVAEYNNCAYCLSAHQFLGTKAGLSSNEIEETRSFKSDNIKEQTCLLFVKNMLVNPLNISVDDKRTLIDAGFTEGEVLEIIGNTIRNMFTNYLNLVSDTEIDWPLIVTPYNIADEN